MRIFATEFEVKDMSQAKLVALVLGWLRGMERQTVLDSFNEQDPDTTTGKIGDVLYLRAAEPIEGEGEAYGFRFDMPDGDRLWRTECVLVRDPGNRQIMRVRALCEASDGFAKLENPKKPFFIKTLVQEKRIATDGLFEVLEAPHSLAEDASGLEQAELIMSGAATEWLPIVYVSARPNGGHDLTPAELNRLAFRLGGVAHVVLEPTRNFSFQLRDRIGGGNPYGGSIGIVVPQRGVVRRLFVGWRSQDSGDLRDAVERAALATRSAMASKGGWDWSRLVDARSRSQRKKKREGEVSDGELLALCEEEVKELKEKFNEKVKELEARLQDAQVLEDDAKTDLGEGVFSAEFLNSVGPELWPGEYSDRCIDAINFMLEMRDRDGHDARTVAVLEELSTALRISAHPERISKALSAATRDPKKLAKLIGRELEALGFVRKSDNKHTRYSPPAGCRGIETITVSKTPGEGRGQTNLQKQIENNLGLKRLRNL